MIITTRRILHDHALPLLRGAANNSRLRGDYDEFNFGDCSPEFLLVAEWHQIRDGKIVRVYSAFDGRLLALMFEDFQ